MHKLVFALGAAAAASIVAAAPSAPAHALVLPAPAGLSADARNIEATPGTFRTILRS